MWLFAKNGSDRQQLTAIYMLALLATVFMVTFFSIRITPDTEGYFCAGEIFASGSIDYLRTPVYPFVCHLAHTICDQRPNYIIAAIQLVVFYISVFFMYRLCGLMINSHGIKFFVSAFYACAPNFLLPAYAILSESLSISLLIIFCYSVIQNHRTGLIRYTMSNFLLLFTLVFLRPIFIFLFPILLILWLIAAKEKSLRKSAVVNLCFLAVLCGIYLSYCKAFENKYGIFSTSIVSDINQYDILRNNGIFDIEVIMDEKMRADVKTWMVEYKDSVDHNVFHWTEMYTFQNKYGYAAFHKFVHDNIKQHLAEYIHGKFANDWRNSLGDNSFCVFGHYTDCGIVIHSISVYTLLLQHLLPFNTLFLTLMLGGITFAVLGIRQRKLPITSYFLWLIVVANMFAAFVGAQAEYARLILPCMPLMLIIIAMLVDIFSFRIKFKEDYKVR